MKYFALLTVFFLTGCTWNFSSTILPSGEQRYESNITIVPVTDYKK